jgi:hypothetical protein
LCLTNDLANGKRDHDETLITDELVRAGFRSVTIENRSAQSRAPSPQHPAIAYCQGTPLRSEIEALGADKLMATTEHAAAAIADRHGWGGVAGKVKALVIIAKI